LCHDHGWHSISGERHPGSAFSDRSPQGASCEFCQKAMRLFRVALRQPTQRGRSSPVSSPHGNPVRAPACGGITTSAGVSMTIDELGPEMINLVQPLTKFVPPARTFDKMSIPPGPEAPASAAAERQHRYSHHHRRRNGRLRAEHNAGCYRLGPPRHSRDRRSGKGSAGKGVA
jgi:hypothetical protein